MSSSDRSTSFDWIATVLGAWLAIGLALDLWAHHHLGATLESFFTPWHAVLYSGFAVGALWLLWHRLRGGLPMGYALSLAGAGIFGLGGLLDAIWHSLFGVELDIEAAISPPHLILAGGGLLILSGPLRASWRRASARPSLGAMLPASLSAGFTIALLFSLTEYANAFSNPWPAVAQRSSDRFFGNVSDPVAQTLGIVGILVQTLILASFLVAIVVRWQPPLGMFTTIFGLATVLVSFSHDWYAFIPVALVAGVAADSAADQLGPNLGNPVQLRLFAFVVPAGLFALYFVAIMLTGTLWWSIDLLTGTVALAGLAGLGVAQLVLSTSSDKTTAHVSGPRSVD